MMKKNYIKVTSIRTLLHKNLIKVQLGFTLIELLLVMSILGILATTLVVAVNPGRQFAKARDSRRESDIYSILEAVYEYQAEHSGDLPDADGDPDVASFPTSLTCIGNQAPCFNLAGAGDDGDTIVPDFMASIPTDPKEGEGSDADTGYFIFVDTNGRLTASASGETKTISITK